MSGLRLVVLGTGFGAFNLVKYAGNEYDVIVVSPRNHFLFTPLLPSTTVGTIEFRSIIEPIRHARKNLTFFQSFAERIDTHARQVHCRGAEAGDAFAVGYDILVIAIGSVSNTFNVPGVAAYALTLKELHDARELRQRIIRCFERANLPDIAPAERNRLVQFVVCGGGPTGVEFAAELHDFPHDGPPEVVSGACRGGPRYAGRSRQGNPEHVRRQTQGICFAALPAPANDVLTNSPVVRVDPTAVHLEDRSILPYGLLLWSTGNGLTPFAQGSNLPKDNRDRFLTDAYFKVRGHDTIYALGDCAVIETAPLPATSQVAQQEGKYLAKTLTRRARNLPIEPFQYKHLGMLAYIGGDRALADLESVKGRGWLTWLFWRSAYLSRIVSLKNKTLVLFDWIKGQIFGRDISQF